MGKSAEGVGAAAIFAPRVPSGTIGLLAPWAYISKVGRRQRNVAIKQRNASLSEAADPHAGRSRRSNKLLRVI